jgi:hypothetical protein
MAEENATEGAVYETYGALVATFQAERAATPLLRRTFARIAADERRHARLAAHVHRWALRMLPRKRQLLEEARGAAIDTLNARVASETLTDAHRLLGFPEREDALSLCARYFSS